MKRNSQNIFSAEAFREEFAANLEHILYSDPSVMKEDLDVNQLDKIFLNEFLRILANPLLADNAIKDRASLMLTTKFKLQLSTSSVFPIFDENGERTNSSDLISIKETNLQGDILKAKELSYRQKIILDAAVHNAIANIKTLLVEKISDSIENIESENGSKEFLEQHVELEKNIICATQKLFERLVTKNYYKQQLQTTERAIINNLHSDAPIIENYFEETVSDFNFCQTLRLVTPGGESFKFNENQNKHEEKLLSLLNQNVCEKIVPFVTVPEFFDRMGKLGLSKDTKHTFIEKFISAKINALDRNQCSHQAYEQSLRELNVELNPNSEQNPSVIPDSLGATLRQQLEKHLETSQFKNNIEVPKKPDDLINDLKKYEDQQRVKNKTSSILRMFTTVPVSVSAITKLRMALSSHKVSFDKPEISFLKTDQELKDLFEGYENLLPDILKEKQDHLVTNKKH